MITSISKKRLSFLEAAAEIHVNSEEEKAFLAKHLVMCTLPHSDPGNVPIWIRENGNVALAIRPGWDLRNRSPLGYPYGSIPRLLLIWLTTEAVRTGNRRVELGDSMAAFMRDIGLSPERGGVRSDRARLHIQAENLFRSTITFELIENEGGKQIKHWKDIQVASEGKLWWNLDKDDSIPLIGSYIEIGDYFFDAITQSAVPIDMRVVKELKKSPLALDLYSFLTFKSFVASSSGRDQTIKWIWLKTQIGCEYSRIYDFIIKSKETLKKIKCLYGRLKIEETSDGIKVLSSSSPSVRSK